MSKVIQKVRLSLRGGSLAKTLKSNFEAKANFVSKFGNSIKRAKNMRLIGASSMALFALLAILTVMPVSSTPETAEATSGTESETTITLTKASADLSLTAVSSDGTFASSTSSEEAKFSVTTTNYTGYTLTIAASDNNQTLVNTDTSITTHNTFSTITSVMDEKTFDNATYNGQWGYKPSKIGSVENVGFWPSPTQTATTLDVTEGANSTANNYTIALGARADYTQATGTYSKTMVLSATANPTPYSITYTDNTNDSSVKNIPDVTGSTTNATSIALSSVTPSRTGYVFAGWCTTAPTNSGKTCSGTKYNAGADYPINQTTTNNITLYATWSVPKYNITIKTSAGISSVSLNGTSCTSTSGCTVNNLTYGQSYTLTATATSGYDFTSWYVDGAGSITDPTLASTTFVVGEGTATITAYGVEAVSLTPPTTVMQNFTNAMCETYAKNGIQLTDSRDNRLYNVRWINNKCWMTDNLAFGVDVTNPSSKTVTINSSNTNYNKASNTTLTLYDLKSDGASSSNHCYGTYDSFTQTGTGNGYTYLCMHTSDQGDSVWYNYAAATAGTITGVSNTTEASYSLCPAGWRLPTNAENSSITSYTSVFSPVYGGNYGNGTLNLATTFGYWWSSTAYNGPCRYYLRYNSGSLATSNYGRFVGYYIRCVRSS